MLSHPVRAKIVGTIEAKPGMNKNQICRALDLHFNLLEHHLARLEDAGLTVTLPSAQGQETLVFAAEDADLWENPRTRILYGRSPTRHVGLYVADNEGASTKEIARAIGRSTVTIRHHLGTLEEHRLVLRYKAGRSHLFAPSEELEDWAVHHGPSFSRPWE